MIVAQEWLLGGELGVGYNAVVSALAGAITMLGGWRGARSHRAARLVLGTAVLVMSASYWWPLFDWITPGDAADMRRGASFVFWPALAWTAWSGLIYSRAIDRQATRLRNGHAPDV